MMMEGIGGMMWGMGAVWLLIVLVLVLLAAALIKYLFSRITTPMTQLSRGRGFALPWLHA